MLEAAKVDMAEFTSTREVAVEAARKSNMDAQQVCRSPPPFTTPLTVLYKSIASLEKIHAPFATLCRRASCFWTERRLETAGLEPLQFSSEQFGGSVSNGGAPLRALRRRPVLCRTALVWDRPGLQLARPPDNMPDAAFWGPEPKS
jgi:hypothetical protein